ncbi:aminomethyl-transferring glycine dehydrogenase subunit GcvPB [Alicyclobacillus mali]|uniref:Probable glycine dehydrogenase (decarboxylating) subunit 2 n=1 Tax=Alicyclobacillus mali (ex Roth et al. 2021) TaxID=1123961 RepID=A0ABS0F5Z3_9BACL|nr:aminomethyl-transferring glycine dehydrogenase subunit GcvPB [Alicyclobacillus mali (ex Roth et al. 2021)]MBF8378725.1 aminomethyl-transferring glycine dehydrogenase subunit GcvPB [Alicyclobacillus mali (ex Roth et al. 2021)]MCL6487718.1 aminomethyl-transferring glycine dehydrogenase subunit GcvPB [Alicyclobacillus mali (ex Roth et al. 2021)]
MTIQREGLEPLIFELSRPGRRAYELPELDVPEADMSDIEPYVRREAARLPEVSEVDVVRHYTALSQKNHGVDSGFYPLGSCTMKYNPKRNERWSRLDGFARIHPLMPEELVQGSLTLLHELGAHLAAITGMDAVSLQPAAGAHGEWTGLMMIRKYHVDRGEMARDEVIVPDSAHGTNPASVSMAGLRAVTIPSRADGRVDLEALRQAVSERTAALMLTNPNTLGLFERDIVEIARIVHDAGGLLYYDGANMNAILGYARPGDMGFDVVHLNLHKTFSTPHGGGGPGAGPVGVKAFLEPYLPAPVLEKRGQQYVWNWDRPKSIGKVKGFFGNFGVLVRAYAYIRTLGAEGLKQVSEAAVLNANYLLHQLKSDFEAPYEGPCKHEFVLSGKRQKAMGVRTLDMAKRLIDFGVHPPTIYFPLIVEEGMMIEPTESESKETLDRFVEIMREIAREVEQDPEVVRTAPHRTIVGRLDEVRAARQPRLRHPLD